MLAALLALAIAPQVQDPWVRIQAQCVREDGEPLDGIEAVLTVEAREGVHLAELWDAPLRLRVDDEGRIEDSFPWPVGHPLHVRIEAPGFIPFEETHSARSTPEDLDFGTLKLARALVYQVRLRTRDGSDCGEGWTLECQRVGSRRASWTHQSVAMGEASSASLTLPGGGHYRLNARHPVGLGVAKNITALPGEDNPRIVEINYHGPDPARRVVVELELAEGGGILNPLQRDAILLVEDSGEEHRARSQTAPTETHVQLVFDDVGPEGGRIVIEDSRFAQGVGERIRPGRLSTLQIGGGRSVRLQVTDPGGAPVPRVQLGVEYRETIQYRPSFLLKPLPLRPVLRQQDLTRESRIERLLDAPASLWIEDDQGHYAFVDLEHSAPDQELRVQLLAPLTIRGVVVDGLEQPVAGCTVAVRRWDGRPFVRPRASGQPDHAGGVIRLAHRDIFVTTDEQGSFTFPALEQGKWIVEAQPSPWTCISRVVDAADGLSHEVELELDLVGHVQGRVHSSVWRVEQMHVAYEPVTYRGAYPKLPPVGTSNVYWVPVNPDGTFLLGPLPFGEGNLRISLPSRRGADYELHPIDIRASNNPITLDLR